MTFCEETEEGVCETDVQLPLLAMANRMAWASVGTYRPGPTHGVKKEANAAACV